MFNESVSLAVCLPVRSKSDCPGKWIVKKKILSALLGSLILGGCVVAPAGRPYRPPVETVYVAPPPPRVESMGPPPMVGAVWIQGYWHWSGSRHDWVPGRWEAPRPGYRYVPHNWVQQGDRWRQEGGRWEEHHGDHDGHDHRERRGW